MLVDSAINVKASVPIHEENNQAAAYFRIRNKYLVTCSMNVVIERDTYATATKYLFITLK